MFSLLASGGDLWAVSITVETQWASGFDSPEPVTARLVVEALGGADRAAAAEPSFEILVPGRVEIDLLAPRGNRVRIEGEGLWAPIATIDGADSSAVTLTVYPTGTLRFPLPSDSHPGTVTAVFAPSLRADLARPEEPFESAEEACTLDKRELICSLPAGVLDLRLEADGFAPIYLWEIEVARSATRASGPLRFVRGTSVAGWVHDADDMPLIDVEIDASPFLAAGGRSDPEAIHRAQRRRRAVRSDEHGFFQFTGLDLGSFGLRARHQDHADFVAPDPVLLRQEGDALVLEPFRMLVRETLVVALTPALGPTGSPWHLKLMQADPEPGRKPEELTGQSGPDGLWRRQGVEPGRYLFSIEDEQGSTWFAEPIEVPAGGDTVFVAIPVIEIEGSLERADEGLAGLVTLQAGQSYERLEFRADEDGEFAGYLPGDGWWHVDVEVAGEEDLALALDAIEIEVPAGGGPARVTVEIPNTRIIGEVVDSEGQLIPNATVKVLRSAPPGVPRARGVRATERRTNADGAFEIRGQPPGHLTLTARFEERTSANVMVILDEDGEPPSQRLVLRGQRDLEGQVVSAFGHVVGAEVVAWADILSASYDGFGRTADVKMATTDGSGVFVLTIPDDLTSVILLVRTPGFGTRLLRHPVGDGHPAMVNLDDRYGTLLLNARDLGATTLLAEGIPVSPVLLRLLMGQRFAGDRTHLELRGMASGSFVLCGDRAGAMSVLRGQEATACKSGFLGPGSVLELSVGRESGPTNDDLASREER